MRFSLIAMLPFFLWLILRLVNEKYGRKPKKLLILLLFSHYFYHHSIGLGLLLPGFFLSFIISLSTLAMARKSFEQGTCGQTAFFIYFFIAVYLFYLQYLDFSPYSPNDELIGVYYLNEGSILSSCSKFGILLPH